ncbi:MAG: tyrosine protein phosphatase [Acidobacteria bacterium]|nr:MAG: tyrosine protein phosphatase [Acidobacteriota bacterium]
MIDIHCHILPGLDDGVRTLDESRALGELLVDQGVTTVVATPHVFDIRYRTPSGDEIMNRWLRVKEALDGRLNIVCGAEVRLVPEIMTVLDRREIFINGGRYLLIEFPGELIPHGTENLLFELMSLGVRPIIAHPERHPRLLADPDRLAGFVRMGCYAQLDAPCLLGKRERRRVVLGWIRAGLIHCVASDAHRPRWRPPKLIAAYQEVEKACGPEIARALFIENPQAIVQDEELPFAPAVEPARKLVGGWWRRWWWT